MSSTPGSGVATLAVGYRTIQAIARLGQVLVVDVRSLAGIENDVEMGLFWDRIKNTAVETCALSAVVVSAAATVGTAVAAATTSAMRTFCLRRWSGQWPASSMFCTAAGCMFNLIGS